MAAATAITETSGVSEKLNKMKVTSGTKESSSPGSGKTAVTGYLPPCRICGGTASGLHYGANTCEACKAFYRRCSGEGYQMKSCPNNGTCTERVRGRLVCVPCRFQLCVNVGMTKGASKKGRYTHERRTQYTKEIKGDKEEDKSTPSEPKLDSISSETSTTPTTSSLSSTAQAVTNPEIEKTREALSKLSLESFPELNAYMSMREELSTRMDRLIEEAFGLVTPPTGPIYSPGPGSFRLVEDLYKELKALELQNETSKQNCEEELPPNSINLLWKNWMHVAEYLFVQMTKFAKGLSGFENLYIDDKIVLLKSARIEITTFMAHPSCKPEKHMVGMYVASTQELLLTPIDMFPEGRFTKKMNEGYKKVMARLTKANYSIEDMNIIIAFILLSPDREDLRHPEQVQVLQDHMLSVLEYTLKKNHPGSAHKLAETLLLLPELREHSMKIRQLLYSGKEETNPILTPLINEVL